MIPQVIRHGHEIKDLDERLLRAEELLAMTLPKKGPANQKGRYKRLVKDLHQRVSRRTLVERQDEIGAPAPAELSAEAASLLQEAMELYNAYDLRGWLSDEEDVKADSVDEPLYQRFKALAARYERFDSGSSGEGGLSIAPVNPPEHMPRRGSEVETWLKNWRDLYVPRSPSWDTVDKILDNYRLRSDYGYRLLEELPDGDGEPE